MLSYTKQNKKQEILKMVDQRKNLGKWGEQKAKEYLIKQGYHFITGNWQNRLGEIDLVMKDRETLVFIEVRTKRSHKYGTSIESINEKKQQQMVKMANAFLRYKQWWEIPIRFDVVTIDQHEGVYQLRHHKNVIQ